MCCGKPLQQAPGHPHRCCGCSVLLFSIFGYFVYRYICNLTKFRRAARDLKGKVIVITGCSEGIGVSLAQQYFRMGARIVITARREQLLFNLQASLPNHGDGRVICCKCDQSQEIECKRVVEAAIRAFGRIDCLFLNAARSQNERFEQMADASFAAREVLDTNFFGAVHLTKFALPYLRQSHGSIVCVSSLAGKQGTPKVCFYSASKGALQAFYDSLRIELADSNSGVAVTTVIVPLVATATALAVAHRRIQCTALTPDRCAREMIRAHLLRAREYAPGLTAKIILLLQPLLPSLMEKVFGIAMGDSLWTGIKRLFI